MIVSSGVHQDVHFGADRIPKGKGVLDVLSSAEGSRDMQRRYHETKRMLISLLCCDMGLSIDHEIL